MKNNLLFVIFSSILVLGGVGAYVVKNNNSPATIEKETSSVAQEGKMADGGDKYVQFSSEVLSNSATTRRVLFFNANWCSTCKVAKDSFLKNISKIPDDVTIIVISYNDTSVTKEEKDLAKKYGITYQHTFVQIDEQGNEITKWSGGDIRELLSNLK